MIGTANHEKYSILLPLVLYESVPHKPLSIFALNASQGFTVASNPEGDRYKGFSSCQKTTLNRIKWLLNEPPNLKLPVTWQYWSEITYCYHPHTYTKNIFVRWCYLTWFRQSFHDEHIYRIITLSTLSFNSWQLFPFYLNKAEKEKEDVIMLRLGDGSDVH